MHLTIPELIGLAVAFFGIAVLYSSVGFGGGSSYLAILALVFTSFYSVRTTALLCNLVVVSGSCYHYYKKGLLNFKQFFPIVLASIPWAYLGASFQLKEDIFYVILGTTLIISALALLLQSIQNFKKEEIKKTYPKWLTPIMGGIIGLLSGLVGIGGGIFLSPTLNHLQWDKALKIASLASFFILVNSLAGIAGLVTNNMFQLPWKEVLVLLIAVFIGGQIGIRLSLGKLTGKGIKIITAILVFAVGVRLLYQNIAQYFV